MDGEKLNNCILLSEGVKELFPGTRNQETPTSYKVRPLLARWCFRVNPLK